VHEIAEAAAAGIEQRRDLVVGQIANDRRIDRLEGLDPPPRRVVGSDAVAPGLIERCLEIGQHPVGGGGVPLWRPCGRTPPRSPDCRIATASAAAAPLCRDASRANDGWSVSPPAPCRIRAGCFGGRRWRCCPTPCRRAGDSPADNQPSPARRCRARWLPRRARRRGAARCSTTSAPRVVPARNQRWSRRWRPADRRPAKLGLAIDSVIVAPPRDPAAADGAPAIAEMQSLLERAPIGFGIRREPQTRAARRQARLTDGARHAGAPSAPSFLPTFCLLLSVPGSSRTSADTLSRNPYKIDTS
jgi:hypothetical protein